MGIVTRSSRRQGRRLQWHAVAMEHRAMSALHPDTCCPRARGERTAPCIGGVVIRCTATCLALVCLRPSCPPRCNAVTGSRLPARDMCHGGRGARGEAGLSSPGRTTARPRPRCARLACAWPGSPMATPSSAPHPRPMTWARLPSAPGEPTVAPGRRRLPTPPGVVCHLARGPAASTLDSNHVGLGGVRPCGPSPVAPSLLGRACLLPAPRRSPSAIGWVSLARDPGGALPAGGPR